jgi:diguanylate cyclase (GGDEF)-like protein
VSADDGRHRTLLRQLRRLHLDPDGPPTATGWHDLLSVVSATYVEHDEERYTLERSIEVSSHEMRGLHEVLSRQARRDTLTGLPNRAALLEHLQHELSGPAPRRSTSVLFVDLDGFKAVNDSLGHAAGDELLVRATERIRGCLRPLDVVARFGGDEFVVVAAGLADVAAVREVGDRVGAALAAPFRIGEQDAVVSASIGIARTHGPDHDESPQDLLRRADLAMYDAKQAGKARSAVYDISMQRAVDRALSVRSALGAAIRRGELLLTYQPILGLDDDTRVVGVEALVRWDRPGVGLLEPEDFLPVAQQSSLASELDCWVLTEAVTRSVSWCALGVDVAINVSARTLAQQDVVQALSRVLHTTGTPPHRVSLELSETGLLGAAGPEQRTLAALREIGVQVVLDDFGVGRSSLSQLARTPVDALKIDRALVAAMSADARTAAVVRAILAMAGALGVRVVAEGVETLEQAAMLRELGCGAGQGWWFGQPQQADAIDRLLGLASGSPAHLAG